MTNEIECPICDRKAPVSATNCPHCGADLSMASFDDLEAVAQSIASARPKERQAEPKEEAKPPEGRPEPEPAKEEPPQEEAQVKEEEPAPEVAQEPEVEEKPVEAPKVEEKKPPQVLEEKKEEKKEEEGRKGLGRLFGRKKK